MRGSPSPSLPLNRRRRLAADVIRHAVDAAHFVDDAARYFLEQGIRQLGPVGGHEVAGLHGAQRHHVIVGAAVAHHADAFDGQEDREGLGGGFVPVFWRFGGGGRRSGCGESLTPALSRLRERE